MRGAAAPGGLSGRLLGPDRTAQGPGDGVGTARRRVAGHADGPGIAAAPLGITRPGACELLAEDRPVAVGRARAAQSRTSRTRVAEELDRPIERTPPASTLPHGPPAGDVLAVGLVEEQQVDVARAQALQGGVDVLAALGVGVAPREEPGGDEEVLARDRAVGDDPADGDLPGTLLRAGRA